MSKMIRTARDFRQQQTNDLHHTELLMAHLCEKNLDYILRASGEHVCGENQEFGFGVQLARDEKKVEECACVLPFPLHFIKPVPIAISDCTFTTFTTFTMTAKCSCINGKDVGKYLGLELGGEAEKL